jgi:hypothetical protein
MNFLAKRPLLKHPQLHMQVIEGKPFVNLHLPDPVLIAPEGIQRPHQRTFCSHRLGIPRVRVHVDRARPGIIAPALFHVLGIRKLKDRFELVSRVPEIHCADMWPCDHSRGPVPTTRRASLSPHELGTHRASNERDYILRIKRKVRLWQFRNDLPLPS